MMLTPELSMCDKFTRFSNNLRLPAGALIQANTPGQFTARIEAFNGATSLDSFTVTSDTNGDAVYIGLKDQTAANITSVVFSLTTCAANYESDFQPQPCLTQLLGLEFLSRG